MPGNKIKDYNNLVEIFKGNEAINIKRYHAIDILRTIAIIGMIQVHVVEWLSGYTDSKSPLYQLSELLGSFPAAMFTFLVGMSLFISIKRQESEGVDPQLLAERNLRRGVAIFFFGLLFLILVWMPEEVFAWDILTFIGASLLIIFPLRNLNSKIFLSAALFVVVVSPVIRMFTDYHSYWNKWGEYSTSFAMPDVLMGFLANAYFPLFPWIVFPLLGYVIGRACFGEQELRLPGSLLPAGSILVIASLVMIYISSNVNLPEAVSLYISPFTFYPASTSFLLLATGINILLFVLFYRLFDLKRKELGKNPFLVFCNRYSRFALTAYVVHHALFLWWLIAYNYYKGELFRWTLYGYIMPTAQALLVVLTFIVLFYLLIIAWDKRGGRYSFEWWLKRLTG